MRRRSIYEIGVASLILAVCAVIWTQAARLPPGTFEPLGSGPVPQWTAAIVILCCALVIVTAARRLRTAAAGDSAPEESGGTPRTALLLCGLTVIYVGLLDLGAASFGLITFGFLTLLIWGLEGFRGGVLVPAAITAAIAAFGAEYLFTNVFVVDLPA
jgi:hypothetical protein